MMWRKALRFLFWLAVVCAVLAGIAYVFFDPWTLVGDDPQLAVSIEPTLSAGDVLLVMRSTGAADGALVRCADPDAPGRHVVGRVVGHFGDAVEFTNGSLLVNGKSPTSSVSCDVSTVRLKNPATQEEEELNCFLEDFAGTMHPALRSLKPSTGHDSKADVESGNLYLASDNRAMHLDSRDFNTVLASSCQRIAFRLWPASGWGDAKKRLTVFW